MKAYLTLAVTRPLRALLYAPLEACTWLGMVPPMPVLEFVIWLDRPVCAADLAAWHEIMARRFDLAG